MEAERRGFKGEATTELGFDKCFSADCPRKKMKVFQAALWERPGERDGRALGLVEERKYWRFREGGPGGRLRGTMSC